MSLRQRGHCWCSSSASVQTPQNILWPHGAAACDIGPSLQMMQSSPVSADVFCQILCSPSRCCICGILQSTLLCSPIGHTSLIQSAIGQLYLTIVQNQLISRLVSSAIWSGVLGQGRPMERLLGGFRYRFHPLRVWTREVQGSQAQSHPQHCSHEIDVPEGPS